MEKTELQITASLAMLSLEDEAVVAEAVSEMLGHFEKMMEVDIEGLSATTHVLSLGNRQRTDTSSSFTDPERLVSDAAVSEDGFYVIPKVL